MSKGRPPAPGAASGTAASLERRRRSPRTRFSVRLLALVFAAAAAAYLVDSLLYLNIFGEVPDRQPGPCSPIGPVSGAEDMVVMGGGELILSSDRRETSPSDANGRLLILSAKTGARPMFLWDGGGRTFRPHGIDRYSDGAGREYLFVVNHGDPHDVVLIFRFEDHSLELLRAVPFAGVTTLNDVTAVGPDSFYVSADHAGPSSFLHEITNYLRLPTGYIDYYDRGSRRRAASGILYANGLAISGDGRQLLAASMLGGKVLIFARDPRTGSLRRVGSVKVGGSPDNITFDESGDLLVGTHPKILALARQQRDRNARSPTLIRRVRFSAAGNARIDTLYSNSGAEISAGSVGIRRGRALLIGSVFDDHILICSLGQSWREGPDLH